MIFYNYYLACSTDPGKVPHNWEPPAFVSQPSEGAKRQGITAPRFCKTCNVFKPPRSHHCSECRRCVLKMDHHCPWINNCVGYDNYGHFVRFVIYVDLATIYVLALMVWRIRSIMDDIRHFRFQAEPSTTEIVFLVIDLVLDIVVLMCVGVLSAYHIYCTTRNQSTIEGWERSKVKTLIERGKIPPTSYPFGVGILKNIKSVLGNNPLLWLWPQKMPSDGLHFPVCEGIDPRAAYVWPPRDPDDLRPSIFSRPHQLPPTTHNGKPRKPRYHLEQSQRQHIRRDSEGFLVREITAEERTNMIDSYVAPDDLEIYEMGPQISSEYMDHEDEYYDSGSAMTDSGDDMDFNEDEESMRRAVNDYDYASGHYEDDTHWQEYVAADYAGRTDVVYDGEDDDQYFDEDNDDTPLAKLIPKAPSKGSKKKD